MNALNKKRILCVGTATIDIIVITSPEQIEKMSFANASSAFLLLEMGRKLEAQSVNWFFGGGATNAAIAMNKLGHHTDCFVKLGQDHHGDQMITHLQAQNIGTQLILRDQNHPTAVSIMVSAHDHDPTILTHRGANAKLTEAEIPKTAIMDYDALYITNLSNESAAIFAPLIEHAHKNGIKIISNPGIRQLGRSEGHFLSLLPKLAMLVINRAEATQLLALLLEHGLVNPHKYSATMIIDAPILVEGNLYVLIEDFLRALNHLGLALGVVTDGRAGAYYFYQEQFYHQPSFPVSAMGTVGAGDAFSSTFSACWLNGMEITAAAKLATLNACSVVQSLDAQSGLKTLESLKQESV